MQSRETDAEGFLKDLEGLEEIGDVATAMKTQDIDHFFKKATKDGNGKSRQQCILCK